MVRQVEFTDEDGLAEFDLAYSNINEKRVEKAWLEPGTYAVTLTVASGGLDDSITLAVTVSIDRLTSM